jgi:hypothetical protein
MDSKRAPILVAALLVAAWYLAATGVTLATPPERRTIETSDTFVLAECDGFDIMDEYSGWLTITEFYDYTGELKRLLFLTTINSGS